MESKLDTPDEPNASNESVSGTVDAKVRILLREKKMGDRYIYIMYSSNKSIALSQKQDLADVKELTREGRFEELEMKMIPNLERTKQRKRPKVCDDEPYIVKLLKSLINPDDQKTPTKEKKS